MGVQIYTLYLKNVTGFYVSIQEGIVCRERGGVNRVERIIQVCTKMLQEIVYLFRVRY